MIAALLFAAATAADCSLATIGVETTDLSRASRAKQHIADATYGALVTGVMPESPAADAGIMKGDAIVSVGGTRVEGFCDFLDAAGKLSCGDSVTIELVRGGERLTSDVHPVSAAIFYDAACNAGDAIGCYRVAWLAASGSGGAEQDVDRAKQLLSDACDQGSAAACDYLGHQFLEPGPQQRTLFERACNGGDATGCVDLAFLFATGTGGVARDDAKATPLFVKGCDGGDPSGCYNVGLMYENGRGVATDLKTAFAAYVEGCEGGFPKACENLALMYDEGSGVEKSQEKAVALYRRACTDGPGGEANPEACVNLAQAVEDVSERIALLTKICEREPDEDDADTAPQIARACSVLGAAYIDGNGVDADVHRGMQLSEQGCDGGNNTGCYNLGVLYMNGENIDGDDARAVAYFKRACDGDDADSCFELGYLTSEGRGVDRDDAAAAALYEKACNGGDPKGCANLGDAYGRGAGVPADAAKAMALFTKACDGEIAEGCYNLANHTEDERRAAELYAKACKLGLAAACEKK